MSFVIGKLFVENLVTIFSLDFVNMRHFSKFAILAGVCSPNLTRLTGGRLATDSSLKMVKVYLENPCGCYFEAFT